MLPPSVSPFGATAAAPAGNPLKSAMFPLGERQAATDAGRARASGA